MRFLKKTKITTWLGKKQGMFTDQLVFSVSISFNHKNGEIHTHKEAKHLCLKANTTGCRELLQLTRAKRRTRVLNKATEISD